MQQNPKRNANHKTKKGFFVSLRLRDFAFSSPQLHNGHSKQSQLETKQITRPHQQRIPDISSPKRRAEEQAEIHACHPSRHTNQCLHARQNATEQNQSHAPAQEHRLRSLHVTSVNTKPTEQTVYKRLPAKTCNPIRHRFRHHR